MSYIGSLFLPDLWSNMKYPRLSSSICFGSERLFWILQLTKLIGSALVRLLMDWPCPQKTEVIPNCLLHPWFSRSLFGIGFTWLFWKKNRTLEFEKKKKGHKATRTTPWKIKGWNSNMEVDGSDDVLDFNSGWFLGSKIAVKIFRGVFVFSEFFSFTSTTQCHVANPPRNS